MKQTLHEKLVECFEDCDNEGRALHGCYASEAIRVIRAHDRLRRRHSNKKKSLRK